MLKHAVILQPQKNPLSCKLPKALKKSFFQRFRLHVYHREKKNMTYVATIHCLCLDGDFSYKPRRLKQVEHELSTITRHSYAHVEENIQSVWENLRKFS